jgi:hypothetical protein
MSDPRAEPVSMTRWRAASDQAHIRSPACCGTHIPRPAGGLRRPGPFFQSAVEANGPLGSATWIRQGRQVLADGLDCRRCDLHHRSLDDDAGAGVPPQATRSLRARATIIVLRSHPPRRWTRSWNHRLSAEVGWFCSHNQASSTMVVLSRGIPALALGKERPFHTSLAGTGVFGH